VNRHCSVDHDHGGGHHYCGDYHHDRGGGVWTMNVELNVGMHRLIIHQTQNSRAPSGTTCVRPCY